MAQRATASQPQSQGILMISPTGETGYVPEANVPDAQKDGGKVGVRMIAPDGSKGVIPFDQQDAAQKSGGKWQVHKDNEAVKAYMTKQDPSAQPGAYQQTKGGAVHNVNEDAHVFDSWTADNSKKEGVVSAAGKTMSGQGYLMQREDESYPQFMARAIEAGKHVTQEQIDAETSHNIKAAPAALAAGPVMAATQLTAEAGNGGTGEFTLE